MILYMSVQEEANSVFKQFETSLCATPRGGAELLFLFACLNCDLYLFVQVQEDVKESSVHGAQVLI